MCASSPLIPGDEDVRALLLDVELDRCAGRRADLTASPPPPPPLSKPAAWPTGATEPVDGNCSCVAAVPAPGPATLGLECAPLAPLPPPPPPLPLAVDCGTDGEGADDLDFDGGGPFGRVGPFWRRGELRRSGGLGSAEGPSIYSSPPPGALRMLCRCGSLVQKFRLASLLRPRTPHYRYRTTRSSPAPAAAAQQRWLLLAVAGLTGHFACCCCCCCCWLHCCTACLPGAWLRRCGGRAPRRAPCGRRGRRRPCPALPSCC
jgi:hypothetical protein